MTLAVGSTTRQPVTSTPKDLPLTWDVTLDASQVKFEDLNRRIADANVTVSIPLSKLGLTKAEARALLDGGQVGWLAPGASPPTTTAQLKGDTLVVNATGVDGRGFMGVPPQVTLRDKAGTLRTITVRTPEVTLREKDPEIRSGWGGSGLPELKQAENNAWQSFKTDNATKRAQVKDGFEGPERREQLQNLRKNKREARGNHHDQLQNIRTETREQRHDRKAAEKADRRGEVTVKTNQ